MSELSPGTPHIDCNLAAVCGNCDWTGRVKQLKTIKDPDERLDPGDEIPAGECPDCGALAYLGSKDALPRIDREYLEHLRGKAQLYLNNLGGPEFGQSAVIAFRKGMAAATVKVVELILEKHGLAVSEPPDVQAAFQELLEQLREPRSAVSLPVKKKRRKGL